MRTPCNSSGLFVKAISALYQEPFWHWYQTHKLTPHLYRKVRFMQAAAIKEEKNIEFSGENIEKFAFGQLVDCLPRSKKKPDPVKARPGNQLL